MVAEIVNGLIVKSSGVPISQQWLSVKLKENYLSTETEFSSFINRNCFVYLLFYYFKNNFDY